MLENYIPIPLERFGGLVTAWGPEKLDASLGAVALNVRFNSAGVMSREGLTRVCATPNRAAVTGLLGLVLASGTQWPLVFDASGALYAETPAGSGTLACVSAPDVTLPVGSYLQGAVAYNRGYLAFGDLKAGTAAPASYDGVNLDPVTLPAPSGTTTVADSATSGNIAAGVRYGMVLFKTRSGTLTAPQTPFSWTAAGGKQVTVSNLPLGGVEVVARIVAFTVAGGSSAGPYLYIPTTQVINGITETSTVVNDNVATSASFNFDDNLLAASSDATAAFRKVQLPAQTGVLFSESTRRLLWWGDPAYPSLLRASEPDDAGTYYGDTGFVSVAENNGQRLTACFEFRNQLFAAKEDSLHLVNPNDGAPATWQVTPRSEQVGIAGPRAVDANDSVLFFVHRSGAYLFNGGDVVNVSGELTRPGGDRPGLWERINWLYGHQIWVHIDAENLEVRIGVPLDQATMPSHILKLNYSDGWEPSFLFSSFTARYHYHPGRRWSLDAIAATQARRIKRPLAVGNFASDRRTAVSQILLASAAADGAVQALDPGAALDNGQPFLSRYRTGGLNANETIKDQRQGMSLVGQVQVRARGQGKLFVSAVPPGGGGEPFLTLDLADTPRGDAVGLANAAGEAVGLEFSNRGLPGAWFLDGAYAFVKPFYALR